MWMRNSQNVCKYLLLLVIDFIWAMCLKLKKNKLNAAD